MEENKKYRLPGLDGLRAIAILLIVLGHCSQADFWYGNCPLPRLPLPGGALSIFFVLSGFLAGYYSETITDAKSYYLKKAKRLFPVYYIYIILVVLVYLLIGRSTEVLNWRLLYYIVPAGIIPFCQAQGILPLVHLWFLTPIVIAYLLFPILLKAFMGGSRRCSVLTLCVFFAALKWILYATVGKETFAYRFISASQFDCIFGGMFLGLYISDREGQVPQLFNHKATNWLIWIAFLACGFYQDFIPAPVRNEFFGLLAAGMLLGLIGEEPISHFWTRKWRFLSKISYQVYVIHILIIILSAMFFTALYDGDSMPLIMSISAYVLMTGISIIVAWGLEKGIDIITKPRSKKVLDN